MTSVALTSSRRALFWLGLSLPVWGATFALMDDAIGRLHTHLPAGVHDRVAPTFLLFLRFLLTLPLLPFVFPGFLRRLDRRAIRLGFLLSLPWYGGFLLQLYGIQDSTPTVAAFLTSLYVVFVPLVQRIGGRRRLTPGTALGVVFAVVGLAVMTDPFGGGFGMGEAFSALCAVSFTFHILWTDRFSRQASPEALTAGLMFWGTVYSGLLTLVLPGGAAAFRPGTLGGVVSDVPLMGNLAFLSVIASIGCLYVVNRFQNSLPPARAALLYTMEPIFAALISWAWWGEPMTLRKIAGGGIILAGNVLAETQISQIKMDSTEKGSEADDK